jgi:aspartate/tyrosine/aromatic aminotransferase
MMHCAPIGRKSLKRSALACCACARILPTSFAACQLAQELRRVTGSDRFGFIAEHRGMFSRLGASPEQVETLRRDHGIYMIGDSRINIAGLNANTVPILARAMIDAGI